jgi:repressor LexA
MPTLTRRQQEIYDYLVEQAQRSALPPTLDALCLALQLSSRGSLHKHIQALVQAGLLEPLDKKQRGLRLTTPARSENELPLLGNIAAGRPIDAITDSETVEVPVTLRTRRPCYVLRVKGDSMTDDSILDGDQIVVEQRDEARNGEIVVALIDGQETTLKRIEQRPDKVILRPANARYKPLEYAPDRVTIQGIVVGLIRSYR